MIVPMVSVVVPTYNCKKYIGRCITSILSQTFKSIEVIIIDDGSDDGTRDVCQKLCARDQRLVYTYQNNMGPGIARNTGIGMARGSYLLFVDADDWLVSTAVQELVNKISKNCSEIISFNFDVKDEHGNEVSKNRVLHGEYPSISTSTGLECLRYIYSEQGIGNFSWAFMYNLEFLRQIAITFPKDISILEDAVFLNRVLRKTSIIQYYSRQLYHYSVGNSDSLTKKIDTRKVSGGIDAIIQISELAEGTNQFHAFLPHGISLLLFLDSRCGLISRESRLEHVRIHSLIIRWNSKQIVRTLPPKRRIKVVLVRLGLLDYATLLLRMVDKLKMVISSEAFR